MSDLISRQDAINALSEAIEDCFVLNDAIKSIQGVPSAQCDDCPYRAHWLTAEINSNRRNGGATA